MIRPLLVTYAFLVPFLPFIPMGTLEVGILDILFAFSSLALLTQRRLQITVPLIALVILVIAAFVSVMWIDNAARIPALLRAIRFAEISMPFFLASSLKPSLHDLRTLVRAFVVGSSISILIGIAVFALQLPIGPVQTFRYPNGKLLDRAGGIFSDSSAYGHLVATWMTTLLAFLPYIASRQKRWGAVIIGAVLIGGVALYASLSRTALLGLAAASFAGLLLPALRTWRRGFVKAWTRVLFALAIVGISVVMFAPSQGLEAASFLSTRLVENSVGLLFREGDANTITSGRIDNWQTTLNYAVENPITGIGYKALRLERNIPPDNNYIAVFVEMGVVGLIAFLLFIFGVLGISLIRYSAGHATSWGLFVVWSGQAAMALTVDIMTFWGTMPGLLAITAVVLNLKLSTTRASAFSGGYT